MRLGRGQRGPRSVRRRLVRADERALPRDLGLDRQLEVVGRAQVSLLDDQQVAGLGAEHPGDDLAGLALGQRVGAVPGEHLAQGHAVEISVGTAGVAEHGGGRPHATARLVLRRRDPRDPSLAAALRPHGGSQPGLGDLVRRFGTLLVDEDLVVPFGEHLGLRLQRG